MMLRAAFTTLEHAAPGVGARWATRLWCTLPTSAGRRRDNRPRPGVTSTVRLFGGRSVVVESWGAGLGHQRILRDGCVVARVARFVTG